MVTTDCLFEKGKELAARVESTARQAWGPGPLADAGNPFHAFVEALLSQPVATLEARYRAADERLRHLEKTEQGLRSEAERVGDLPAGTDVGEMIGRARAALEHASGPVPPQPAIEDDLEAVRQVLGVGYGEAVTEWGRLADWWKDVGEAIRAGSSQEAVGALRQWLLGAASLHHACAQPDRALVVLLETVLDARTVPARTVPAADACRAAEAAPATPEVPAPCTAGPLYRFKLTGEIWSVVFGNEAGLFKDRRGMKEIAVILSHPNRRFTALELQPPPAAAASGVSLKTITAAEAVASNLTVQRAPSASVQDRADEEGLRKVLTRLVEVQEEMGKAAAEGSEVCLKELREEERKCRDYFCEATGQRLDEEMTGARLAAVLKKLRPLGPGGPAMKAAESLRKAIARVKAVLRKKVPGLVEHLGEHLRREGSTFAYYPPEHQPKWDV
jgi:hypothetical protein